MMDSVTIRAVNRLERNIKRLIVVEDLLRKVCKENDVADCELWCISHKVKAARGKMNDMRKALVK